MDEAGRMKIIAGMDTIVALLLLIAGILITILGVDYVNTMSSAYYGILGYNPFSVVSLYPWIIVVFGMATIIYGIKRMIDNILKIIIARS